MLRVDKRAGFRTEGAWFWKRHRFTTGKLVGAERLRPVRLAELDALQREQPVALIRAERRQWWWFHDVFYWEDDGLSARDVMALVSERERRKQRVPREIRLAVWQRDGGRCRDCGSDFDLQYDHIIPFSLGGATSTKNLQLLCGDCNRAKGAAL